MFTYPQLVKFPLLWKGLHGNIFKVPDQKRVIKVIRKHENPEEDSREEMFWSVIKLDKEQKRRLVAPLQTFSLQIPKKGVLGPKGLYTCFVLEEKRMTLGKYIKTRSLTIVEEKTLFNNIVGAISVLYQQGFVHSDLHLENILLDQESSSSSAMQLQFFLIDFGMVMHKEWIKGNSSRQNLYVLYRWSKDDFFTLLLHVLFSKQPQLKIKDNDYKKNRLRWIDFFSKNAKEWGQMKKFIELSFDFKGREDFRLCLDFFFHNILCSKTTVLTPKQGIPIYDMLVKVFLDRFFIIFAILFPQEIGLQLSKERANLYKLLLVKMSKIKTIV